MKPLIICFLPAIVGLLVNATLPQTQPEPALRLPCKVIEVVDGDTVTVEITLQARVRLLDCWSPERTTPEGAAAHRYMQRRALNKTGLLEIDLTRANRLDDVFSFGRLLGRIYLDGDDLSQRMVKAGHATTSKEPQR
jgi:endonuclease YncB( thermonuclease family)